MPGTAQQAQFERKPSAVSLRSRIAVACQSARERYQQMQKGASECIARHPGKSMAAMAIAGIAVGILLGRRGTRD